MKRKPLRKAVKKKRPNKFTRKKKVVVQSESTKDDFNIRYMEFSLEGHFDTRFS